VHLRHQNYDASASCHVVMTPAALEPLLVKVARLVIEHCPRTLLVALQVSHSRKIPKKTILMGLSLPQLGMARGNLDCAKKIHLSSNQAA